uniref:Uncharacterized protein n=1 Tax=Haemonchus contortus TaxID=6289 RepID=A0A7I4XU69_HAECO|nr:unnamed protein product [Haemonchus contortus]
MERQRMERLQNDYDAILRALPPLPEPEDLYARIIRACRQFWVSPRSVDNLGLAIRTLRASTDPWQESYASCRVLVETVERIKLELLLVRSQLVALWALPNLLMATHRIEPDVWRMMINRPQMDDDGNPLLVHNQLLKRAILDRLEILGDQAANLREYGNALEIECRQEESQSRDQLRAALESMRSLISDFVARSEAVSSPEQQIDNQGDGAGAIRIDAQYMEQLHDPDEEEQLGDDLVSVNEDAQGTDESSTETSLEESDDDNQEMR